MKRPRTESSPTEKKIAIQGTQNTELDLALQRIKDLEVICSLSYGVIFFKQAEKERLLRVESDFHTLSETFKKIEVEINESNVKDKFLIINYLNFSPLG